MWEILGIISGALTTMSLVPGVISIWRMRPRPAIAISLLMYIALCVGVSGWIIYGIAIESLSVIIANSVTLPLALSILIYKIKYG